MADSSQLFNDDEREQTRGPSDDELRHITGISPDEEGAMDREAHNGAASDIAEREGFYNPNGDTENSGGPISGGGLKSLENAPADKLAAGSSAAAGGTAAAAGLYSGTEAAKGRSRIANWFGNRKRSMVATGILITLTGGGIFLGGIASGPFQLVQLSHILQHPFAKSQSDSSSRINQLFRYSKAAEEKNIGYTRVGLLGRKIFGGTISQLEAIGITYNSGATNLPSVNIDKTKLEKSFPETKNMTDAEFRSWLGEQFGVDLSGSRLSPTSPLGKDGLAASSYKMDTSDFRLKALKSLINSNLGLLDDGKIITGVKTRVLGKFFGLGSLFHPFKRAFQDKVNQLVNEKVKQNEDKNKAQAEATEEVAAEELNTNLAPTATNAAADKAAIDEAKGSLSAKITGAAMAPVAVACIMKSTAGSIVKLNYDRIVVPSEIEAMTLVADGAQIMYGQGSDLTEQQVGQAVKDLTDSKGHSIWQSPGIAALNGGSVPQTKANTLPADELAAFSGGSTAAKIEGVADQALNPITSALFGISPCGTAAAVGIIALSVVGAAASALSGGLGAVLIAGGAEAGDQVVQAAIGSEVLGWLENMIVKNVAVKSLAIDAFKGPMGGELISRAARAGSNTEAIASGSISLANYATTIVDAQQQEQEQQQFQSESMYARMFDLYDSRSLFGHLADSISSSWSANLSSLMNGMLHIGGSFSSIFSALLPKASAGTNSSSGDYNWGFPQYGIPDSMLNSPELSDPYANADAVAGLLQGSDGSDLKQRANECFGVNITGDGTSDSPYDVIPQNDVDPNSDSYASGHCSDIGSSWNNASPDEQNWQRMIMFVFDSGTMKSAACYDGDNQSCADEGLDSTTTAGSSTSPTAGSGSTVSGNSATLAKEVLANPNITLQKSCVTGPSVEPSGCAYQDILAASQGQQVTPGRIEGQSNGGASTGACSARTPVYLDATLLQAMLNLAAKYKYTIQDIDSGHDCDTGLHPQGKAFDVYAVSGMAISGNCSSSTVQDFRKYAANVMAQLVPNQSGNNMPGVSQCGGDASLPSGVRTFFDSSDQVHIDLGYSSSV